jgi:hypothetical protein
MSVIVLAAALSIIRNIRKGGAVPVKKELVISKRKRSFSNIEGLKKAAMPNPQR